MSENPGAALDAFLRAWELISLRALEDGLPGYGEPNIGLLRLIIKYDATIPRGGYKPATGQVTFQVSGRESAEALAKDLQTLGYTVYIDGVLVTKL